MIDLLKDRLNNKVLIRSIHEECERMKKEIGEDKVFDYSIGNPNVPCPKIVHETLIDLLTNMDSVQLHSYTSASGIKECKEAIINDLKNRYGVNEDSSLLYMISGASSALSVVFKALLNKNDESIVFGPYFSEYKVFIENADGIIKVCPPKENFLPDFSSFEKLINHNTKTVIINSPNNPTGVIYDESVIKKLCSILEKKEKEYNHPIYLISDEPYRELIFNGIKYPFITKYYNNSIVIYSYSKSLSLPGERIGYILVSKKMEEANLIFDKIQLSARKEGYICESSLFQYLISRIPSVTSDLSLYDKNRKELYNYLTSIGFEVLYPSGAFYLFLKIKGNDVISFCQKAMEFGLYFVPGDEFGKEGKDYVRISYCVDYKQIINSLPSFKLLSEYYGD